MANKFQKSVRFQNKAAANRMAAGYRKQFGLGLDGKPRAGWKEERGRCPFCGRDVATYVPADGDGSARLFRPHNDTGGPPKVPMRCAGSKREDSTW